MSVSRETHCGADHNPKIAAQIEQRRQGDRKLVRHGGTLCCRCLKRPPLSKKDRYCALCRAADRRKRRAAAREELQRLKALEQKLSKGKDNGQITRTEKAEP